MEIKIHLTDEELNIPLIDDLLRKYQDWLTISKEGGRTTRAANKRADSLFEDLMAFSLPPLRIEANSIPPPPPSPVKSIDSTLSSNDSRPNTRSRTPLSTPKNQRIRSNSSHSSNSANVLTAALNQQHPSVSVTKIRQLLRADSAQKKREEERERLERLALERKLKEERAEIKRKELLEKKSAIAKQKREQRLLQNAELRKAREQAKRLQVKKAPATPAAEKRLKPKEPREEPVAKKRASEEPEPAQPTTFCVPLRTDDTNQKVNETFQKPSCNTDNIDISVHDETTEESNKVPKTAVWARAPHLRNALVKQFNKSDADRSREVSEIFPPVQLPVELDKIFGTSKAGPKLLQRTSSVVWSPPHRPMKRTSSMVMTPANEKN